MRNAAFVTLALSLAACTQPPAQVLYKGSESHGKRSSGGMQAAAPRPSALSAYEAEAPPAGYSNTTEGAAGTSSIGISDLPPPSPAPKPAPKPTSALTPPEAPKAEALKAAGAITTTQPWKPKNAGETPAKTAFILPAEGKITQHFGKQGSTVNDGITIAAAEGEPVAASADGEVVYAGDNLKGYGKTVILRHAGGKSTSYAHMARIEVERYQRVKQGDTIGYVGATGGKRDPQLHFTLRDGNKAVDPESVMKTAHAALE